LKIEDYLLNIEGILSYNFQSKIETGLTGGGAFLSNRPQAKDKTDSIPQIFNHQSSIFN